MVWAAQAAETRAKRPVGNRGGLGRNALAVSLFKRSGELVEWGAQFDSPALGLLAFFQTHFRESPGAGNTKPVISGRFPHVLIERLGNLGWNAQLASTPPGSSKSLLEVAKAEFDWVVHRQTGIGLTAPNESGLKTLREDLCRRGHSCLDALARVGATLGHFASLFAVEAFINQQLD